MPFAKWLLCAKNMLLPIRSHSMLVRCFPPRSHCVSCATVWDSVVWSADSLWLVSAILVSGWIHCLTSDDNAHFGVLVADLFRKFNACYAKFGFCDRTVLLGLIVFVCTSFHGLFIRVKGGTLCPLSACPVYQQGASRTLCRWLMVWCEPTPMWLVNNMGGKPVRNYIRYKFNGGLCAVCVVSDYCCVRYCEVVYCTPDTHQCKFLKISIQGSRASKSTDFFSPIFLSRW